MLPHYKMYIDGKWVDAVSHDTIQVRDPATEKIIATVENGDLNDAERAIQAARRAFDSGPWPKMTGLERSRLLYALAQKIKKNKTQLAKLETLNMGKSLEEAGYDINDVATCFEYYAGMCTKIHGDTLNVPDNAVSMVLKEPIGVCGQIIPWNYPLLMAAWKLAPALAAGCTVILKPASVTPLTALALGKLIAEVGFPKGVVNIVIGGGETVGMALARSMLVDKVAFTGSVEVGQAIMKAAAESNVKKVTLELGGKSANIVYDDADFEAAVDGALFGIFVNQGEVCSAGSRILVQKTIYKKFVDAFVKKTQKITIGPGLKKGTKMGPLVSETQLKRVLQYIAIGKKEGARLACGGKRPAHLSNGYFIEPTVFTDVKNHMRIAQEEIFGPVAVMIPFTDETDAIKIANESKYGLAGAVWTRDLFKALRTVKAIRAGILWVNCSQPTYVEAPWGGYKMSGFGRELSHYGIEEYLVTKQVHINLTEKPLGWF